MILNLLPPMQAAVGIVFTRFLVALVALAAQVVALYCYPLAAPCKWMAVFRPMAHRAQTGVVVVLGEAFT